MATTYTNEQLVELELQARNLAAPGALVPLLPPKSSTRGTLLDLALGSSTRSPFGASKHSDWKVDTFVVPAAFPRSLKSGTTSTSNPKGSASQPSGAPATTGRIDASQAFHDLAVNQLHGLRGGKVSIADQQELREQEQLFLAVNRYVNRAAAPSKAAPLLTLVFAHANGFHKETWEPVISDLLDSWDSTLMPIGEIWCLDAVNQGDSAVLNEAVLGTTFDWSDHGRDIANFLISYLPDPLSASSTSSISLPYISTPQNTTLLALDNLSVSPGASYPTRRIFRNRLIVGIGHSLGGGGMAFAATAQPSLFSSIILCDPVLPPPGADRIMSALTKGACVRKETWVSKQDAKEGFLKKAFFRGWNPRSLDLYVELATKHVVDKDGKKHVALKCRAKDEALVFGDLTAGAARRAAGRLALLPSTLPVHFIFAEKGSVVPPSPDRENLLGLIPLATHFTIPGSGHLIVQERPTETAMAIGQQLRKVYGSKGLWGVPKL
ncbi:BZ3500_MvSof-1268-A1-R1_Chr2-1g04349 [Microbotryum saponariae]|uniref:BZ3500_MvSof-1268-A1-R1_Chr2-1g04349 protein n=1 Tax=Microbotryum saponariae TaxID=289078 RepID=A0A2X0MB50_9BASI|nr:BZ3500_MvSof-1268-A1-R1_Chr2-1g04349 [Microbotryum saponariae]SCZ91509.1 BZ3501_MvSof-1269-A2-R1_Chr2-1g04005 [Microbotryum saponariae]